MNNKSWYSIKAQDKGIAEISIYDYIGYFEITAKDFISELNSIKAQRINLMISSGGGEVWDGLAIYNALLAHEANIITYIQGIAASISSVIALAGNEVNIAENAFYMIHNPWSVAIGESKDMKKTADMLDKVKSSLVSTYMKKTGKEESEINQLMDDESWFTAQEAKDEGFVDSITEQVDVKASYDLSNYHNVPAQLSVLTAKIPSEREIEQTLREAGKLSRNSAKAILAKGYKGLTQRDADEDTQREADKQTNNKKELIMDIKDLKAKHSDLYQSIVDDAKKEGLDEGLQKGHTEGAAAERARIIDVEKQLVPGCEALIEGLKYDGKTSGPEAAVQVIAAEKVSKAKLLKDIKTDSIDPVDQSAQTPSDTTGKVDPNLPVEERTKAEWDKDPVLRAEFMNSYEGYLAYVKANEGGRVKALGK